jgi:hypothetical protein
MNLADVVKAALSDDDFLVRSWILELRRNPTLVSALPRPDQLDACQMAVAADSLNIANLLGTSTPSWVNAVAPSPEDIFCLPSLRSCRARERMRFTKALHRSRSDVYSRPPDYLSVA